tara:strand:+ start:24 stop:572 length:549 start_codon:yes stop_codon:yes gene_type:complete
MKKILFVLFCCVALIGCSEFNQNETSGDFYSTEVDTSYSYTDRTKIEGIKRTIYDKRETNSFDGTLVRAVGLQKSLFKKEQSLMLSIIEGQDIKSLKTTNKVLHFDDEDELKDFFSKVDTLKIGEELNERKKTTHYIISKEEKRIVIQQWRNPIGGMSDRVKLSLKEYVGIKDAYNKFANEQ